MNKNIKAPISTFFSKLIENKKFTVPFSIFVSFIFWLIIMVSENPVREITYNDIPVTIQLENTYAEKQGLSIVSDVTTQKFSVTLSGPSYIVSAVKPEDFLLTASVEEVNTAGVHSLKILPKHNSKKGGYNFVSVVPEKIDVNFDFIDTKEFEVVPRIEGFSADEGLIAEKEVVTNEENKVIKISGPRSVLERVDKVVAFAKSNEKLKKSKTYDANILLYDKEGKIIYRYDSDGKMYNSNDEEVESKSTYITPAFTKVKVTAPIVKTKSVPIKAVFSDRPEGMTDSMIVYSVEPSKVTVIGTPDNINKLEQINLLSISYKSINKNRYVFESELIVPEGLKIVEEIDKVKVTVDFNTTKHNEKAVKAQ